MNRTLRDPIAYFVFVAPSLALFLTFFAYPLLSALRYGFTEWNGVSPAEFNGLANFARALSDPDFWVSVKNNLWFVGFSVFVQIPFILLIAVVVSALRRGHGFYKTTVFLPSILSTAVIGVIWSFVYHPEAGLLNQLLRSVGLSSWAHAWLAEEKTAMLSVLVTNAWQWTGFYVVLTLAAIFAIPKELTEAATIDGAVGFRRAWYVTVPLIRPVIAVMVLLSVTGAMKALDIVFVMTEGGPYGTTEVMATYMYRQAYKLGDYGYANAIAILIFVFTTALTLAMQYFNRRTEDVQ